jgi:hypothetical protein
MRPYCVRYVVLFASLTVLVASANVSAGGFWLKVGTAQFSNSNGNPETVLTVNTLGCHEPQNAVVSAQAVGLVAGKQQSIQLRLDQPSPGAYQIVRQWPPSGVWVVAVTAEYRGIISSALVKLGPEGSIPLKLAESSDGASQNSVQVVQRKLTADDLNLALSQLSGKPLRAAIIGWPLPMVAVVVAAVALGIAAMTSRMARTGGAKRRGDNGVQEG